MNISFTIIIPVYNTEKYISNCIESILNQKYNNYEIIIVDDCSTDRTLEIIKQYKSDNIKTFSTPKNSGPGIARNIGIQNAQNEYILFCDSDDYYLENAFEKIHNTILNSKDHEIYYFTGKGVSNHPFMSSVPEKQLKTWDYETNCTKYGTECLREEGFSINCQLIYYLVFKKNFILQNNILFKNYLMNEDCVFIAECLFKNPIISFNNINIYIRRLRENSIMMSGMTKRKIYGLYHSFLDILTLNKQANCIIPKYKLEMLQSSICFCIQNYYDREYSNNAIKKIKEICI